VSTLVPPLFAGLVDDASVLPPSITGVTEALESFRTHRSAWFAELVGSFLVPSSLTAGDRSWAGVAVGVVNDTTIGGLPAVVAKLRSAGADVRQVEAAVARRGEDPQPGLGELHRLAGELEDLDVYAEIPLSWGLLAGLDTVARARAAGLRMAPKFRVGGLAAELFPTPVELAAVICACRDRGLPFKLTAGLHHALRHTDPETGFLHHGFLNVLAGAIAAADGAEAVDVAEVLATTDALPLVETVRLRLDAERPLWIGYGTCSLPEPLEDMERLGLLHSEGAAA
jgi:hypothetical protein